MSHLWALQPLFAVFTEQAMRQRKENEVGIHILLVPAASSGSIPSGTQPVLERAARDSALMTGCVFKAMTVRNDHMHVLIQCSREEAVGEFIETLVGSSVEAIHAFSSRARSFEFDDRVHVTLLPPWHVDLFIAFIRDQDHYHANHSLQDELSDIFVRGAANIDENSQKEIMESVAHIGTRVS